MYEHVADRLGIGRRGRAGRIGPRTVIVCLLGAALPGCAASPADQPPVAETVSIAPAMPAAPELPAGVRLVGMDAAEVEGLLGAPALQRREAPAQYWRYSYAGCTLDLFLYTEQPSRALRVAYYEVRTDDPGNLARNPHCERIQASLGRMADNSGLPEIRTH